jgi:hypothetical protein
LNKRAAPASLAPATGCSFPALSPLLNSSPTSPQTVKRSRQVKVAVGCGLTKILLPISERAARQVQKVISEFKEPAISSLSGSGASLGHAAVGWRVSIEDRPFKVVRTNGGDEVLARAANLLCQRGRQLVTLRRSWHSEPQPRWASGGPDVALMIRSDDWSPRQSRYSKD